MVENIQGKNVLGAEHQQRHINKSRTLATSEWLVATPITAGSKELLVGDTNNGGGGDCWQCI